MHRELSDSELVQRLSSCSPDERREIYLVLYERYKNLVLKVAFHYVRDYDSAGELMQEVFLRMIQSVEGIKDPGVFKSWILTITRNICVDFLRRTSYLTRQDSLDPEIEVSSSERVEDKLIAGLDRQKILECLRGCVQKLHGFDLKVFKLRWQGLRAASICRILSTEKPEVRRAYDRMKRTLEVCMERKGLKITIDRLIQMGEIDDE